LADAIFDLLATLFATVFWEVLCTVVGKTLDALDNTVDIVGCFPIERCEDPIRYSLR
jgi:hypothetical protein